MSRIYLHYGGYRGKSEELLRRSLGDYLGIDMSEEVVLRQPGGKPYIEGRPVCFSVSHTEGIWGCLVSGDEAGLDIQRVRKVDSGKLADRFFLEDEAEYVRDYGIDGFFPVWVRKEACVKYFGTGMFKDMKSFSVVGGGKLAERVDLGGSVCYPRALHLGADVKCAYCLGNCDDEVALWEL